MILTNLLIVAVFLILAMILLTVHGIATYLRKPAEPQEREFPRFAVASAPQPHQQNAVELLSGSSGNWLHHSWRPEGHKDVAEALATSGMAIQRGDVIEEGHQ